MFISCEIKYGALLLSDRKQKQECFKTLQDCKKKKIHVLINPLQNTALSRFTNNVISAITIGNCSPTNDLYTFIATSRLVKAAPPSVGRR